MKRDLEYHPLANLFPLIEGEEFDALVGDVRAHGLQDPIDVYQGKILDGRNRYRAACEAGIELENRHFRAFHPEFYGDPLTYVLSKNLKRRHLDESQRAMVAARLASMRQGERTDLAEPSANLPKVDQPAAAKTLSISERALRHARAVQTRGIPELNRAVDHGKLAVSVAEKAAAMPVDVQRRVASEAMAGNAAVARSVVKAKVRENKEKDLADKTVSLPASKFNVIYADPPWRFEPYSRETGMDRAPENHYPTMTLQQILDLPVPTVAADDCVLFLWATVPMLPEAFQVMTAWGFTYKSHCIWNKNALGTGYWFRNKHELLLVGVKGDIPAPLPGTQYASVIDGPVKDHSRKPVIFRGIIEGLFPNLPKIELFARTPALGWGQWGKEAPEIAVDDNEASIDGVTVEDRLMAAHRADDNDGVRNAPEGGYPVVPASAPVIDHDDGLDIPAFLRRTPKPEAA